MQENGERFYNYPKTKKENRVNNKNSCDKMKQFILSWNDHVPVKKCFIYQFIFQK